MEGDMSRRALFTLISKGIVFAFIVFFAFWSILPQYSTEYFAALNDKVDRLMEIEEPKIVLIGNSSTAFGFECSLIEDAFGMPVVNMGLHGGIGNAFHEEMAKLNVKEGDVYIVCHSTFFDDDTIGDGVRVWTTVENNRKLWKLIRMKDIPVMLETLPVYMRKSIDRWRDGEGNVEYTDVAYARNGFNEYGDVKAEYKTENKIEQATQLGMAAYPISNDTCMERINDLNKYLSERGATLLIAASPIIVDGELSAEELEDLDSAQNSLREKADCEVISDFKEYCFDVRYFYDTDQHLNAEGAIIRTNLLIDDLKKSYFTTK